MWLLKFERSNMPPLRGSGVDHTSRPGTEVPGYRIPPLRGSIGTRFGTRFRHTGFLGTRFCLSREATTCNSLGRPVPGSRVPNHSKPPSREATVYAALRLRDRSIGRGKDMVTGDGCIVTPRVRDARIHDRLNGLPTTEAASNGFVG